MNGGRTMIDTSHVLAQIAGLSGRRAAQLCGVAPSTIRTWRSRGTGHDLAVNDAAEHIANSTPRRPGPYVFLDVWITPTVGRGWRIEAYDVGTADPTAPHGLTAPDIDTAVLLARQTWHRRIDTIRQWTPEQGPVDL